MSGEKKHWRLSTPFRRSSGTQDPRLKAEVGRSGSRVSNVYLSDDSSTCGFTIVPEFDYPVQTQTTHENSNHNSSPLPPDAVDGYSPNPIPKDSKYSYLSGSSCGTSIFDTSRDDNLTRRLDFAYEHIRSMSSAASPKIALSSDPQILRKQLGVPQHSVFNHPIHSSPDLPNPHASRGDPTSPGSSPATSPDVSHARISNELGSFINMDTNIYPASPPHHFQDPIQPAQSKTVVTTPTLTENFPSQCSPLGTPWSAHIACTSKPQPFNPNPSKLAKRRVEKPAFSAPSQHSSGRQASRGVLRKPGVNTSPSANAHRRQNSLPQLRPPSPFRVDIVSFFITCHSTSNAVTSSSPFIMHGTTVEPILTLPLSVIPR